MNNEETYILNKNGEKIYGMWYAKDSCRACYGRGWSGIDSKTKEKIMCRCVKFIRKLEEPIKEQLITSIDGGICE